MKIHCAAQILNELTEVKQIYQELCSETNLAKLLDYIESDDAESQKGALWVLGYSALKYKMHEGLTSRVSIINESEDEEVNMLDDDEKATGTEQTIFKDETDSAIYKTCFQAIEPAAKILRGESATKETQYAESSKICGLKKMRAVEFLAKLVSTFSIGIQLEMYD